VPVRIRANIMVILHTGRVWRKARVKLEGLWNVGSGAGRIAGVVEDVQVQIGYALTREHASDTHAPRWQTLAFSLKAVARFESRRRPHIREINYARAEEAQP
jgi:hypothetical protein